MLTDFEFISSGVNSPCVDVAAGDGYYHKNKNHKCSHPLGLFNVGYNEGWKKRNKKIDEPEEINNYQREKKIKHERNPKRTDPDQNVAKERDPYLF